MKKRLFAVLAVLCVTNLMANPHEEAQELFSDAECMACHNQEDFKPNKKIDSFKKLSSVVDACRFNNGVEWFDDESESVSKFLNDTYYKFPQKSH